MSNEAEKSLKDMNIRNRLYSDYELLVSKGYDVLGVFLQGSQNYELDYEGSDVDTKAIVIPSFTDFVLNKKPVSTTLVLPSNEHLDVKDIRLMFECFKKQNINFLEILFTDYCCVNPKYSNEWDRMVTNANKIAHYNNYAAVNCIAGMIYEKREALCHRYEGLKEKIDKYGYDSKQLHHIVRCREFLERYIAGESYKECLVSKNKEHLIKIKSDNAFYNCEQSCELADRLVEEAKIIKEEYMNTHNVFIDHSVEDLMNSVLVQVFKISIIDQIK